MAMTLIDLSKLPPPKVIEELSFTQIRDEIRADYLKLMREEYPDADLFDSDPASKLIDVVAAREVILRQRVNDGAKACLYPFSEDADLDNLVSFFNTEREDLPEIDPETKRLKKESNESLRERGLLAFDQFSTAGAPSAYAFHTKKVGIPLGLADMKSITPKAGDVQIVLLFSDHTDKLDKEGKVIEGITIKRGIIENYLSRDDIKPQTDRLIVDNAKVKKVRVKATIFVPIGVDKGIVTTFAISRLQLYADSRYRIGADIPLSGLYAALTVPNVERVKLDAVFIEGEGSEGDDIKDIVISDLEAGRIVFNVKDIKAEVGQ